MDGTGIRNIGGAVEIIDLPDPRPLEADEVLIDVKAAGVGNWDQVVRTGVWEVGAVPPMALGVEAAGTICAVGNGVEGWRAGDEVMTHPLPLRHQGTWTKQLIAPAGLLARKPDTIDFKQAAVFPVPALTAEQVLTEALKLHAGERLLVHGAGSSTGAIIVALAILRGAEVIATAGPGSAELAKDLGACLVLDLSRPKPARRGPAANRWQGRDCRGERRAERRAAGAASAR